MNNGVLSPDVGPHPKSGLRSEPAASLGCLEAISTFHGKRPRRLLGVVELTRLRQQLDFRILNPRSRDGL